MSCRVSATNLAIHHHLSCDLYLHNAYHRKQSRDFYQETPEILDAQFQRGNNWEKLVLKWLDRENLLLTVPSVPLDPSCLLENIEADGRDHFFIAGLTFIPPQSELNKRFVVDAEPVTFGLAKPDLLEIIRTQEGVIWKVIDVKASANVKTSHHVQIYFYTICLDYILPRPFFRPEGSAAIWLPPRAGFDISAPSLNDLKSIDISLLSPSLDQFLFERLPHIISLPRKEVKWHYNPLCRSCPYQQECKTRALDQGELGSMPNISLDDVRTLQALLRISSSSPRPQLTDIEDLHELIAEPMKIESLAASFPTTVKRSRCILGLPKKSQFKQSPVVNAAITRTPQIKAKRNLACPRREDIAVIISLIQDPSTPGVGIAKFTISIMSRETIPVPSSEIHGPGSDLISALASLIRAILAFQSTFPSRLLTQFYVWSTKEASALQKLLIDAALTSTVDTGDVRTCIGALAQGASLLQTTFQPLLLSGALLGFLSKSGRTKAEYKNCLERMGCSTEGTINTLRRRVDEGILRLQSENGRPNNNNLEERAELGQLPRVVVLEKVVERLIALPVPGFWDLPECASVLLPKISPQSKCLHDEDIFSIFRQGSEMAARLDEVLTGRNATIYQVLRDVRARVSDSDLLVNDARVLSSNFMDICQQTHLRKLFFMQQFEVLTKLNELWHSRIDGCPDAPLLQYVTPKLGADGLEHVFYLISGVLDMPAAERGHAMYDKIIVLDEADDLSSDIPVEVLFDDLAVSGLVFPLSKHTMAKWSSQPAIVQNGLSVADIRDLVIEGHRTRVVIQAWSGRGTRFIKGRNYRLSPRLVDFNTSKTLAALLEMDLRCDADAEEGSTASPPHYNLPLLQMIIDPSTFGKNAMAAAYLKTGNEIQKLFRELKGLDSEAARSLVLKPSQHRAAQRILTNRLSVIWGPPGTGKTYTIALSILRLLDVHHRHGDTTGKVIFITAMTHAAIAACQNKLMLLMESYRNINSLPTDWLDQVSVEQVLKGNEHPAPSASNSWVHIYAGTIYQLYNFTKRRSFMVDCVIVDEAGQLGLSSIALVLRSLKPTGRIVIAGDSEQLAPILSAQYPQLSTRPLFGSVLDCVMGKPGTPEETPNDLASDQLNSDTSASQSSQSSIVQLTENFRLNPDLGEFVSTIYSRAFKPQKVQARQLARDLQRIENDVGQDLGIQPDVLGNVQAFLLSLSKVMLREQQKLLCPPGIRFRAGSAHTGDPTTRSADLTLVPHPISLALIDLRARIMRDSSEDVGYEVHVRGEAAVAAALVVSIQRCSPQEDIFVATPHRVQREAVKAALGRVIPGRAGSLDEDDIGIGGLNITDDPGVQGNSATANRVGKVTVDTIERLQGSEAAFVICLFSVPQSSTTPDLNFLLERRRLNVAISRAKTLCVLVTSQEVLRPRANVLANEGAAKGYAFLRAFEERAWSCALKVDLGNF